MSKSIIPAGIAQTLATNYANAMVTEIKKQWRGYEVELNTGLEEYFNEQSAIIGLDQDY